MVLTQTQIEQELLNDVRCDACQYASQCDGWRKTVQCKANTSTDMRDIVAVGVYFQVKDNGIAIDGERRIRGLQAYFAVDSKYNKLSKTDLIQRIAEATRCVYDPQCGYSLTIDDICGKTIMAEYWFGRVMLDGLFAIEAPFISNDELRKILINHPDDFDVPKNFPARPFFVGSTTAIQW